MNEIIIKNNYMHGRWIVSFKCLFYNFISINKSDILFQCKFFIKLFILRKTSLCIEFGVHLGKTVHLPFNEIEILLNKLSSSILNLALALDTNYYCQFRNSLKLSNEITTVVGVMCYLLFSWTCIEWLQKRLWPAISSIM